MTRALVAPRVCDEDVQCAVSFPGTVCVREATLTSGTIAMSSLPGVPEGHGVCALQCSSDSACATALGVEARCLLAGVTVPDEPAAGQAYAEATHTWFGLCLAEREIVGGGRVACGAGCRVDADCAGGLVCHRAGEETVSGYCTATCASQSDCGPIFSCEAGALDVGAWEQGGGVGELDDFARDMAVCVPPAGTCGVCRDDDGDGAGLGGCLTWDCNDADPDAHPLAYQYCDDRDLDCSGASGREAMVGVELEHCIECDSGCEPAGANQTVLCADQSCLYACEPWYASCDGLQETGCETNIGVPRSCGRCGDSCYNAADAILNEPETSASLVRARLEAVATVMTCVEGDCELSCRTVDEVAAELAVRDMEDELHELAAMTASLGWALGNPPPASAARDLFQACEPERRLCTLVFENRDDCGACGVACGASQTCALIEPGTARPDALACVASSCPPGADLCPGEVECQALDTMSNCRSCGNNCLAGKTNPLLWDCGASGCQCVTPTLFRCSPTARWRCSGTIEHPPGFGCPVDGQQVRTQSRTRNALLGSTATPPGGVSRRRVSDIRCPIAGLRIHHHDASRGIVAVAPICATPRLSRSVSGSLYAYALDMASFGGSPAVPSSIANCPTASSGGTPTIRTTTCATGARSNLDASGVSSTVLHCIEGYVPTGLELHRYTTAGMARLRLRCTRVTGLNSGNITLGPEQTGDPLVVQFNSGDAYWTPWVGTSGTHGGTDTWHAPAGQFLAGMTIEAVSGENDDFRFTNSSGTSRVVRIGPHAARHYVWASNRPLPVNE